MCENIPPIDFNSTIPEIKEVHIFKLNELDVMEFLYNHVEKYFVPHMVSDNAVECKASL